MLQVRPRYVLIIVIAAFATLVAHPPPVSAAPPDYAITGEACHNHSYYFMGWAEVSADCLSINASTLNEDKGRVDLVGWAHHSGSEIHQTLMLDCLVVEKHSETGDYMIFGAGTNESGTRFAVTLDAGPITGFWAGPPTGSAPCNSIYDTQQANQNGGAFAVAPLEPDLNQRPTAAFTYSCDAYSCTFDASQSFDPDGEIVQYRWRIGDYWWEYAHYTGATITHSFRCACTENVTLTVVDEDGGAGNHSEWVTATTTLDANFVYECNGLTCTFDGSGSTDDNGTIETYEWTFGDGTTHTSSSPFVTHTYPSSGGYYTYLYVTDNDGTRAGTVSWIKVEALYELTAQAHHQGQRTKITLRWSGSEAEQVHISRNGAYVTTVNSSSKSWSEHLPRLTSTVTYRVCDSGASRCSNTVSVTP